MTFNLQLLYPYHVVNYFRLLVSVVFHHVVVDAAGRRRVHVVGVVVVDLVVDGLRTRLRSGRLVLMAVVVRHHLRGAVLVVMLRRSPVLVVMVDHRLAVSDGRAVVVVDHVVVGEDLGAGVVGGVVHHVRRVVAVLLLL